MGPLHVSKYFAAIHRIIAHITASICHFPYILGPLGKLWVMFCSIALKIPLEEEIQHLVRLKYADICQYICNIYHFSKSVHVYLLSSYIICPT